MITNAEFLEWGGFNIEAIICMVRNFGLSIFCFLLIYSESQYFDFFINYYFLVLLYKTIINEKK